MKSKLLLIFFVAVAFASKAQTVAITSSASGTVCSGTSVTFTATVTSISSPTYQWYKNGTAITGETSSTYSTTTLSNNDQINVKATPAIVSAITVTSNLIANLDAGNSSSYSGTGNTWTDLTGNGNNVTLSNTGYSSVNGGGIALNATGYGTQTLASPPFNGDFTWSTIFRFNDGIWDWLYNVGGYNGLILTAPGKPGFSWGGWYNNKIDGSAESSLTDGNYYMLTFVRSGNAISCYLQASPYGIGSNVSGNISLVSPTIGKGPGGEAWPNGIVNLILLYNRALTQSEITQNYNTYAARFGFSAAAISSNTITATIAATPSSSVTVSGDACANKTTLTTASGSTSYAWYKDNVVISGATSNVYTPTAAGVYKVEVTSGSCSSTSTSTTIYNCAVTSEGRMVSISNASSIISPEGGLNFGTGKDISGKLINTTILTTTSGTIGTTTAVLGGVISATNAVTSSIGVLYSTASNFNTYSTTSIGSNVAAGTFTSTITGLTASTTYYAKSFIVNGAGTSYGDIVSFTTSAPSFVTDGLVLNLDAGNSASYAGTGTTWTDLSGRGNNGTLVNSVTYNSSNQGILVFNGYTPAQGPNPYVLLPTNTDFNFGTGDFSVDIWIYITTVNDHPNFLSINVDETSNYSALRMGYYLGNLGINHSYDNLNWAVQKSAPISTNAWKNIVVSRISGQVTVYIYAVSVLTYSLPGSLMSNSRNVIGTIYPAFGNPGFFNLSGKIATTKFYNGKGLTSSEVTTHFNLLKSRFGL
jgi:Concanavalin A-like lectin/glucanases superfamily